MMMVMVMMMMIKVGEEWDRRSAVIPYFTVKRSTASITPGLRSANIAEPRERRVKAQGSC